jgi:hypothetical protein
VIVCGVDVSDLPAHYEPRKAGRTLLLDGDGPAYAAAATVKTLPTAIKRFHQKVLEQMFLLGCDAARVHLTDERSLKSGRHMVHGAWEYQENRANGKKAKPALLEPLRRALAQPENQIPDYTVHSHRMLEADDGLMHDAYIYQDSGLMWSEDKDLRQTPFPYYDSYKGNILTLQPGDTYGDVWMYTRPSGGMAIHGHGRKFFWSQMLTGDSADHVKGILSLNGQDAGPVRALAALAELRTEAECADFVLDAYRAIGQNPLPEAWMLWMLRSPTDSAWSYLNGLEITDANRAYLAECFARPGWYTTAEAASANRYEALEYETSR